MLSANFETMNFEYLLESPHNLQLQNLWLFKPWIFHIIFVSFLKNTSCLNPVIFLSASLLVATFLSFAAWVIFSQIEMTVLSFHLSVSLPFCLFVHLSIFLSVRPSVHSCRFVLLSVWLWVCMFIRLSVCPSFNLLGPTLGGDDTLKWVWIYLAWLHLVNIVIYMGNHTKIDILWPTMVLLY